MTSRIYRNAQGKYVALIISLFFCFTLMSHTADALCCVVSNGVGTAILEESSGVKNVGVCFDDPAAKVKCESGIDGVRLEMDIVPGQRGCKCYTDKVCDPKIEKWLNCPDIQSSSVLRQQTLEALNIDVKAMAKIAFTPSVTIPGSRFIAGTPIDIEPKTIAEFITALYKFVIGTVGLLAVVGIMIGGFQYLMAAGSPDKISEAKTSITSAIIGLIIALTSYVLLGTINKDLVDFTRGTNKLTAVDRARVDKIDAQINGGGPRDRGTGGLGQCDIESSLVLVDAKVFGGDAKYFEITDNPALLQTSAIANLIDALNAEYDGMTLRKRLDVSKMKIQISSTYRNKAEQMALKNCDDYSLNNTICPYNCSSCASAATPTCGFGHQSGLAVDLCLIDLDPNDSHKAGNAECGQAKCGFSMTDDPARRYLHEHMQAAKWGLLGSEWWHFEAPALVAKNASTRYRVAGGGYTGKCGVP